ncbi:MAG: lipid-A-disaccharide synthase [Alphaproteobacteria bacterium]
MSAPPLHVYLVAGEPSGDALGARLMAALRARTNGEVRFSGLGGPQMVEAGLVSLFDYGELAVMGVFEILPRAVALLRRMREVADDIAGKRPDVIVTIDVPAFAFGVAKRLPDHAVPRVHYGAPTIWAWRPWRVHKYKRAFDHILAVFPFEPPHFHRHGLACTFVGHAVLDGGADRGDGPGFRHRHGIPPEAKVVCVLPGSRRGEVERLVRRFGGAVDALARRRPGLVAVVPTVPNVAALVRVAAERWRTPAVIVATPAERHDAMAASDVALAASGTVGLELAMATVPAAIAYRVAPLTALALWLLLKVPYVSSTNLIVGRKVLPEFLQDDVRPEPMAEALDAMLDDGPRRAEIAAAQREAMDALGRGGPSPSDRAAGVILDIIGEWRAVGRPADGGGRR